MSFFATLNDAVGSTVEAHDVEIAGKPVKVFFRQLMADEAEQFFLKVDKNDPKKNVGMRNQIIAKVVCDAEGLPCITPEEVGKLPNKVADALQDIALKVNTVKKDKPDEPKNV